MFYGLFCQHSANMFQPVLIPKESIPATLHTVEKPSAVSTLRRNKNSTTGIVVRRFCGFFVWPRPKVRTLPLHLAKNPFQPCHLVRWSARQVGLLVHSASSACHITSCPVAGRKLPGVGWGWLGQRITDIFRAKATKANPRHLRFARPEMPAALFLEYRGHNARHGFGESNPRGGRFQRQCSW
jgi:hypothetical protein